MKMRSIERARIGARTWLYKGADASLWESYRGAGTTEQSHFIPLPAGRVLPEPVRWDEVAIPEGHPAYAVATD